MNNCDSKIENKKSKGRRGDGRFGSRNEKKDKYRVRKKEDKKRRCTVMYETTLKPDIRKFVNRD
jgi:hypothetical protein